MNHTQTPWKIGVDSYDARTAMIHHDGEVVAFVRDGLVDEQAKANAVFLIRAANHFEAVLAALKAMRNTHGMHGPCRNNNCRDCGHAYNIARIVLANVDKED